jgi:hypothetical protein
MLAGGDGSRGCDHVVLDAEIVVAVLEVSLVRVQRPTAGATTLGDDHAARAGAWHLDVRRHRMRLVLQRQHAPLADPHSGEQELAVPADQLRAAGDVGIDPLEAAVIERNHVVLDRLDEPEPLQFSEFLRVLGGEIGGLGPVVGTVQLPDIGVAGSSALTRTPCGRNSIAAVWVRLRTAALDAA